MVERKRGSPVIYFLIFCKNCCHSATNLPKSLCFRRMRVVAARWEVASPTPSPSPIGRGAAAHREVMAGLVTSNDSPNAFTTVKTAFSCAENTVFQRRKRRFPAWQRTHCAQPLPSLSGRGWGWGFSATSHLAATTSASPLYKGFPAVLVAEWQQKQEKNFLSEKRFYNSHL